MSYWSDMTYLEKCAIRYRKQAEEEQDPVKRAKLIKEAEDCEWEAGILAYSIRNGEDD